ncbi:hypothetical protein ACS2QP_27950, partial [Bacillus cereus group sp. Bce019]|uniref:hypothetical protein n=1 Tax=Bacillus cereus group sp. Bce019 TaxID=3445247 RepID=UPI003F28DFC0
GLLGLECMRGNNMVLVYSYTGDVDATYLSGCWGDVLITLLYDFFSDLRTGAPSAVLFIFEA